MLRTVNMGLCRFLSASRKELFLSCIAAILLVLSFPAWNLRYLAWAAFVPLFAAVENKGGIQAFFLAYLSGFVFWLGTVYWLVHVTVAGMLALVLYLSFYWGIFGLSVSWYRQVSGRPGLLFIPSSWVVLEYCRSHAMTGFPWALTAYTQSDSLSIIQISDVTGAWGVSFLVVMVNTAAYAILRHWQRAGRVYRPAVIMAGCAFMAAWIYGAVRLRDFSLDIPHAESVKVSVIQGNIPQELKWDANAREYIMRTYTGLSLRASVDSVDLLVWPEAAVPVPLSDGSDYQLGLQALAESWGTALLTGAVTRRETGYYNSAVLFQPGVAPAQYDKIHLVPFGEYIPLSRVFGFLQTIVPLGEVQRGSEYRLFRLGQGPGTAGAAFSCLICYEDMFPELSRRMVQGGAEFLVTVTNDAWYQRTAAPFQHFQASVFRSVENKVWMVRSANTGVSGFVRPDGIVLDLVANASGRKIFVPGFSTGTVTRSGGKRTLYTIYGDWFVISALIIAVLCSLGARALPGARRRR